MRYFLTFFFLLFASTSSLSALEAIGAVIALEGNALATTEEADRPLQIDSPIYVGDTIKVGSSSRLQIRYSDGGLLNLIPDTEYKIKSYQYKKLFKKDHYFAELVKGGFRSLSGSIAKKNPQEYEVETPTSTLGLRGTTVEARITNGVVYFAVESGLAEIMNAGGSRLIGVGARSQYAVVYASNQSPEYLESRPKMLDLRNFAEPNRGFSIDAAQLARTARGVSATPPSRQPQSTPPLGGKPVTPAPDSTRPPAEGGDKAAIQTTPTLQGQEGEDWQFKSGGKGAGGSGGGGASVGGGC